jgi:hypothetical protein
VNSGGGAAIASAGKKTTSRSRMQPISGSSRESSDACVPISARKSASEAAPLLNPKSSHAAVSGSNCHPSKIPPPTTRPPNRARCLKKKKLARLDGAEPVLVPRAPEVDFVLFRVGTQELIPLLVGHPDVAPHGDILLSSATGCEASSGTVLG